MPGCKAFFFSSRRLHTRSLCDWSSDVCSSDLVESWEIAAESITNRELRRRSSAILPLIREGRSFTESLESADWMPALAKIGRASVGKERRSRKWKERKIRRHDRLSVYKI